MPTDRKESWFKAEGIAGRSGTIVAQIYFATGSSTVGAEETRVLRQLIEHYQKKLNAGTAVKLYFAGHADARGQSANNQKYSERRAQAVQTVVDAELKKSAKYGSESGGTGCFSAGSDYAQCRRVDVMEWSQKPARDKATAAIPQQEPEGIKKQTTEWDKDIHALERGDKQTLKSLAIFVLSNTADDQRPVTNAMFKLGGVVCPPWWSNRERTISNYGGKPSYVQKALLAYRDLKEYYYWDDMAGALFKAYLEDHSEKKHADLKLATQLATNAMLSAHDLAVEVFEYADAEWDRAKPLEDAKNVKPIEGLKKVDPWSK